MPRGCWPGACLLHGPGCRPRISAPPPPWGVRHRAWLPSQAAPGRWLFGARCELEASAPWLEGYGNGSCGAQQPKWVLGGLCLSPPLTLIAVGLGGRPVLASGSVHSMQEEKIRRVRQAERAGSRYLGCWAQTGAQEEVALVLARTSNLSKEQKILILHQNTPGEDLPRGTEFSPVKQPATDRVPAHKQLMRDRLPPCATGSRGPLGPRACPAAASCPP